MTGWMGIREGETQTCHIQQGERSAKTSTG